MASSPSSSLANPPNSSDSPPSPPPSAPINSNPDASSDPPASPFPVVNATPPLISNPPPPFSSSPPLSNPPPPQASPSQPSPDAPSPPLNVTPPSSQPPPPLIESSPPIQLSPPPVVTVPPPPPSQAQPSLPPSLAPPGGLSSPPPSPSTGDLSPPPPPSSGGLSPPPPFTNPPPVSPPPPSQASPPSVSPNPPSNLNPPSPPTTFSPPSPPPSNSSSQVPPTKPPIRPPPPSLTTPPSNSPGLPSPTPPSRLPSLVTPGTPSSNDSLSPRSSFAVGGGSKTGMITPIAVVSALAALSLIGISFWFLRKHKKKSSRYAADIIKPSPMGSSQFSESSYPRSPSAPLVYYSSGTHGGTPAAMNSLREHSLGNSKPLFSFEELHQITQGFSEQNVLGEGGFGCVYKGCLPDGREVAVKQLKVGGSQGEREFRAEVEIISRVHHRHLVSLVGYCIAESQRLLVYDYVPNNTLHYHLHGNKNTVMDWAVRVKVAAGAARGIAYLHEDCHPRIIHRDIKSSNILLDNNFEAQVSDFGLARLAMDAWTHVSTRVMGTFGYLAPEYASTGKLTERSDAFSFGVVLLELITGRKPVDSSQPLGDESLVEWARPLLSTALETGDFGALPDSGLERNYNVKEMFRMIEAAAACVRHSASMRPRMSLVVRALDSLADMDLSNGLQPGQSEMFNVGPQSEEIRMFQRMAFGTQNFSNDFTSANLMSDRVLL